MFIRVSKGEGIANAIYRSPEEIVADIEGVRREIASIRERLNLRALVVELISDERVAKEPNVWIDRLEGLVEDARDAEENLGELKRILEELREELYATQWALGLT